MTQNEVEPLKRAVDNVQSRVSSSGEETRQIYLLLLASLVVLLSAISPCSIICSGTNGLALAISIISIAFGLVLRFAKARIAPIASKLAILLVLLWGVTTAAVTFSGPFKFVGNGYFGCYAALISSVMYMKSTLG